MEDQDSATFFSSRHLFFVGDDDDSFGEGFQDYVPSSVDPGPTIFLVTLAVSILTILLLPCLVIIGNRYEKKRILKQQQDLMEVENKEGMVDIPLNEQKEVQMMNLGGYNGDSMSSSGFYVKNKINSEVSFKSSREHNTEVVSAMTNRSNVSSYIHGRGTKETGVHGALNRVVDRMLMPPYPDDDTRSIFSYADKSNVGSIASHVSQMSAHSSVSCRSNVFDARIRKRRKGCTMNKNGFERARRINKQVEKEEVDNQYSMPRIVSGREGFGETRNDAGHITQDIPNGMKHSEARCRGRKNKTQDIISDDRSVMSHSVMSKLVDDISPNDAADANDPGQDLSFRDDDELQICCGKNALWRPRTLSRGIDKLSEIADFDKEAKRILKLSIPFTITAIMETVFELVAMGLIGHFIGTDALAAYSLVEILIGTTGEFVDGLIDAQTTTSTHAVGVGNNYLAGQYVQMAAILYVLAMIPSILFWSFFTYPALIWFDMGEHIAQIGQEYAYVALFVGTLDGLYDAYHGILEITDHEIYVMVLNLFAGLVELLVIGGLMLRTKMELVHIAWINLVSGVILMMFSVTFSYSRGWMRPYWAGMFKNLSLKNTAGVRNLVGTAVPLAIGNLLAYAEWEVLTLYATHLGPAEVTTWAVLGSLWETFEASTEGIGDGAEVRCAYHLGKGNPDMARKSSYKSILIGILFSILITAIFFIMGEDLPKWFTTDITIQEMLLDVIPLVGLGNISMTFGMVCWALIGAQGRYRLATSVTLICSWGITMPLGALMIYVFNYDLKGLTSAVVIGYTVTGTVMSYIILRSDWGRLSEVIIELNRELGEVDSSDSDGDDDEEESDSSASSDDDDSSSSDDGDSSSDDDDSSDSGSSDSDSSDAEKRSKGSRAEC